MHAAFSGVAVTALPPDAPGLDAETSLTFARGLSVFGAFDADHRELSLAEIAKRIGLSRSATRRLVRTLEHLGFVTMRGTRASLTARVLSLSHGFLQARQTGQILAPVLAHTAHVLGEPVSFAEIDGDHAVYLAHSPMPAGLVTVGLTVGSRIPLLVTSIGRAILAHLPATQSAALIDEAATDTMPAIDRTALAASLDTIRARGYAYVADEYVKGLCSLSTPVFGLSGAVVGATGLVAPTDKYDEHERRTRLVPALQRCAALLAGAFG